MKLWYMLGQDVMKIENIVETKYGQTYYIVTHKKPGVIGGPNITTKVFTRYIVKIEEF